MKRTILTILLFLLIPSVYAVRVASIYQATLPAKTQSPEEKNELATKGLTNVLIKVTGNPDIMDNPSLKFQLNNAARFIQNAEYTAGTKSPFLLKLKFDEESVNRIVHDADITIWDINRPLILAWMVFQAPGKSPEIIDNSSMSDIKSSLKVAAENRGVPVIFPVMDVDDLNQVSVNDVVNMNKNNLQNAAKRYSSEGILVAKIYPQNTGFAAESQLVLGSKVWNWTVTDNSVENVINKLVDNVAGSLLTFASQNNSEVQGQVTLRVSGLAQHSDYDLLIKYLKNLTPVANVELIRMAGNTAILNVNLRGSRQSFEQAVAVGEKLLPLQPSDSDLQALVFQWKH